MPTYSQILGLQPVPTGGVAPRGGNISTTTLKTNNTSGTSLKANQNKSTPTVYNPYNYTSTTLTTPDYNDTLTSNSEFEDYDNPGGNVGGLVRGVENDPMDLKFRTEQQRKDYFGTMGGGTDTNPGAGEDSSISDKVKDEVASVWDKVGDAGRRFGNWYKDVFNLSDIRLKKNIKLIDISKEGYNIYSFEFKNPEKYGEGTFQGVLSHDIPQEFVNKNEEGYDMVDYSYIDVEFKNINKSINTNNDNMKIVQESGVEISTVNKCRQVGTRVMTSRNMNIKSDLSIGDIIYKGNATLNANR